MNNDRKKLKAMFFKAIRQSDTDGLKAALAAGADIHWTFRKKTVLEVVYDAHLENGFNLGEIAGPLLKAGCAWPVRKECCFARLLIVWGNSELLLPLIDNCADATQRKSLREAIQGFVLDAETADEEEAVAGARVVFPTVADVDCRWGWRRQPVLHRAVMGNMSDHNYIMPCLNGWNGCPLASWHLGRPTHTSVIDYFLSLRPKLEARWAGFTALHLAAALGNEDGFSALVAAGADFDALDGNDRAIGPGYGLITESMLAKLAATRLTASLGQTLSLRQIGVRARL